MWLVVLLEMLCLLKLCRFFSRVCGVMMCVVVFYRVFLLILLFSFDRMFFYVRLVCLMKFCWSRCGFVGLDCVRVCYFFSVSVIGRFLVRCFECLWWWLMMKWNRLDCVVFFGFGWMILMMFVNW